MAGSGRRQTLPFLSSNPCNAASMRMKVYSTWAGEGGMEWQEAHMAFLSCTVFLITWHLCACKCRVPGQGKVAGSGRRRTWPSSQVAGENSSHSPHQKSSRLNDQYLINHNSKAMVDIKNQSIIVVFSSVADPVFFFNDH